MRRTCSYTIQGGEFDATGSFNVGVSGATSSFTQSGGLVNITGGAITSGASAPYYLSGGQLNMNGGTIGGVSLRLSGGTVTNASSVTSGVTLSGTTTVIQNSSLVNGTVSGIMSGSGGGFVKADAGTLTLTAANTYTGLTTVNGGTLELAAAARTNVLNTSNGVEYPGRTTRLRLFRHPDETATTTAVLNNLKASYTAGSGPWTSGPMFSLTAAATTNVGLGWV